MNKMTPEQAHTAVVESFAAVAPEIKEDLNGLGEDVDVFEEFGLDSMDHVNVMTQIFERTEVTIPERNYAQLRSLRTITDFVWSASGTKLIDM